MTSLKREQLVTIGFLVVLLGLHFLVSEYSVRLLNQSIIASIVVLGLNFAFGWAGLITLAQAAFVGFGAYGTALLTTVLGFDPWLASGVAVLGAALIALLLGIPTLRLSGHYLALATLGLNVSFGVVASNWIELTGGTNGIVHIPSYHVAGLQLDSEVLFFRLAWVVLIVLTVLAYRIRMSRFGREMIALRDDEIAVQMSGVNAFRLKMMAFVIGAAYAAAAGVLFAHHSKFISPGDFDHVHSIFYLSMLIIGGEGAIFGAILGAVLVTFLPEWLKPVGDAYLSVFGVAVILVLVFMPRGLVSLLPLLSPRQTRKEKLVKSAETAA
ncbi:MULTISPECIES: branched-chain amino acid ABC transporter permease [Bradyrhizobium]|uniref:branched-chain amino acid ABC transporter permease n=1 Tax=Bradyrhizobium TaxID=374 RepID=UPI0004816E7E|nr:MULTISPECIES: branched-chain amino acid ABC transporter permease [Bradyrhizobium]UFW51174.1 branched-chain amino acid ABC transporter permease [Bradyrhizobium arachidis]